jgi:hypothetical protein
VGQLLGRDGRNLLIGTTSNLRRWAGSQLGLAKPGKQAVRPRTNLREIAGAVRWRTTRSSFEQRLVYERLMAEHVAPEKRRDLKTPAYLRLDLAERFPRVVVSGLGSDPGTLYGPFRDRRAAAAARDALHKLHPLRPCDYVFEPDPALPLGLGCVYAQVRSCAAPCLARVGEEEYRRLARAAALQLADPAQRAEALAERVPRHVSAAAAAALVVERTRDGLMLFPILAGAVLDDEVREASDAGLEAALQALRFAARVRPADDTPWILQWLRGTRRAFAYLVVAGNEKRSPSAFANAVRSALAAAARASPAAS